MTDEKDYEQSPSDGEGAVPEGEQEGEGAGLGPPPSDKVLEGWDREPRPNRTPTSSDVGYQTLTKADIRAGADPSARDFPEVGGDEGIESEA